MVTEYKRNLDVVSTIMATTSIVGTELYTSVLDMATSGWFGINLHIQASFPGTATDDLDWWLYARLDGTFSGNEVAVTSGRIAKANGATKETHIQLEPAPPYMRVGVKRSGSTDSINTTITSQKNDYQGV